MVFTTAQKSPNIWATFVKKIVTKTLKKSPNLLTMVSVINIFFSLKHPCVGTNTINLFCHKRL